MDDPVRVISTVQVGITAVAILTGAIGEPLVRDLLGGALPGWLGFLVAFIAITYVTVVFGELVPKALTLDRAEALAVLVGPAIQLLSVALRPVVWVLEASAQAVLRMFGVTEVAAGATVRSPEELRALVDEAEDAGVIPAAQEELLHNVFDFARREARDVMVPAPEVAWLDASWSVDAALDRIVDRPHSRYPVGEGSLDRLVGVVHVRDLAAAARTDPESPVGAHAQPAPIVPESKDLGALLRELRERRRHLAVVVDEYGGTAGIVTLEDILEELVGEIEDEYDLPDDTLSWIDDHTVCIAGSMTVDDFNEAVGTALPQDGAHTMAGLVFNTLGRRPAPGDTVTVDGVSLMVERVDGLRITQLRAAVPAPI
jgi:putative hemolysin